MSSPCPCPGLLAFNGFIVDWISRLGLCTADHSAAASAGGHLPTHLGGNLPVFINMTSPGAGPLVTRQCQSSLISSTPRAVVL